MKLLNRRLVDFGNRPSNDVSDGCAANNGFRKPARCLSVLLFLKLRPLD